MARSLAAHQLQVLLAAGDPTATQAAPGAKDNPVVFKAMAQLVEETVTVKDKNGNVIEATRY